MSSTTSGGRRLLVALIAVPVVIVLPGCGSRRSEAEVRAAMVRAEGGSARARDANGAAPAAAARVRARRRVRRGVSMGRLRRSAVK